MKGIVFSFSPGRRRFAAPDWRYIIRRRGITALFAALLTAGLAVGAVYAQNADEATLGSLDFLFTTNLSSRLSNGAVATFCACFASDFVFLLGAYLLGTAAWGIPFLFALTLFKGFGTGVTAGFLCLSYSLGGAGFYLLVLLPGTFVFCAAFICFLRCSFAFSKRMFLSSVSKTEPAFSLRQELLRYSSRFATALIIAFFASLLDTVLWTLFAGTFNFS